MTILYSEGFNHCGTASVRVPIWRTWLQRLFRRKPAGTAYIGFQVQFDDSGWRHCEVIANYPKGADAIQLDFQARLDGKPIYFGQNPVIADSPCAT